MRKDKEKAFNLRKSGKSYKQIKKELRIPMSTLSDWFREVDWSVEIKERLTKASQIVSTVRIKELDKIRGEHLARIYEEAKEEAHQELETLKYNPLFIAGMMLYWGEGDKATKSHVRLANTDPEMIKLFLLFLDKVCRVPEDRIKAQLLIYPDIDSASNLRFWSFATGIPLKRFTKSVLIQGRHKTKRGNGVCTTVVSSTYLKVKMLEWLKYLPKELMNKAYYENM